MPDPTNQRATDIRDAPIGKHEFTGSPDATGPTTTRAGRDQGRLTPWAAPREPGPLMDLFLIRHTPVEVAPGVCYGSTDVACRAAFPEDARRTAAVLDQLCPDRIDHWITSPARRCRDLTGHLLEHRAGAGQTAEIDQRWLEMDFGSWELRRWSELPRQELADWQADYVVRRPAGGETFGEVALRTWRAMDRVRRLGPDAVVVVVAHGGSIRAAISQLLDMPLRAAFRLQVDHGSVTHVRLTPRRPELHVLNRR